MNKNELFFGKLIRLYIRLYINCQNIGKASVSLVIVWCTERYYVGDAILGVSAFSFRTDMWG